MLIATGNWFLKEKPVIHSLRGIEDAAHAQLLGAPTLSSLRAERLSELHIFLHPSVCLVQSRFAIVTSLVWSLAHVYFLIVFRNRLAVAMNWCWNYVTFQRGTRLITGISGSRIEDVMPAVTTAPEGVGARDSGPVYAFKAQRHNNVDRQRSPQHV
jgi:hypothetical protein